MPRNILSQNHLPNLRPVCPWCWDHNLIYLGLKPHQFSFLTEVSIALRLERKSALFFFTEVIWQRFCYNCPFCEKLTNIKPAWNISVFSTGFRVSVFLIGSNYFMQVRINFFIWQAFWQILHWSSILLSLYVGLVLKWQCWCLASHFESLGLVCWFCRRPLSAHNTRQVFCSNMND